MTIGERIKSTREILGISQVDLAKICGITKQSLYKYENNIITNIPSDKIELLADALKVSPAYLMGWEGNHDLNSSDDLGDQPLVNRPIPADSDIKFALFGTDGEITDEMLEDVKRYAQFIKERKKNEST